MLTDAATHPIPSAPAKAGHSLDPKEAVPVGRRGRKSSP